MLLIVKYSYELPERNNQITFTPDGIDAATNVKDKAILVSGTVCSLIMEMYKWVERNDGRVFRADHQPVVGFGLQVRSSGSSHGIMYIRVTTGYAVTMGVLEKC